MFLLPVSSAYYCVSSKKMSGRKKVDKEAVQNPVRVPELHKFLCSSGYVVPVYSLSRNTVASIHGFLNQLKPDIWTVVRSSSCALVSVKGVVF